MAKLINGYLCCLTAYFDDDCKNGRYFDVFTDKDDFNEARELFKQKYPEVKKIGCMMFDNNRYKFEKSKQLDLIKEFVMTSEDIEEALDEMVSDILSKSPSRK